MVIIEGPDGAGKTTLVRTLAAMSGWRVARCVPDVKTMHADAKYQPNLFWWYAAQLLGQVPLRELLVDRHYLSEKIYGPTMRNFTRLTGDAVKLLDELCVEWKVVTVICLPPWKTVRENWMLKRKDVWDPVTRKGDYVDGEQKLWAIYNGYATRLEYARAVMPQHYLRYDYTFSTALELQNQIKERWKLLYAAES